MLCYGPDIIQLEACWLNVKKSRKDGTITTDQDAVKVFIKVLRESCNILSPNYHVVKSKLNAAMFVAVLRSLLPEGPEDEQCQTMHEIFGDMTWLFYLKLVHGLCFEEELRDCLCLLDEEIYVGVLKLIMETCKADEELKVSRMANPVLGSIFKRYQTLKPAKRYHEIISSAALWLLEIKPEEFKDFYTYYACFVDTAGDFADMLIKVIADHLYEAVGENYKIGVVPKIRNLKPFTSARHWIHMARLFHNYICPHHWHQVDRYAYKMSSIRFLLRCLNLFEINVLHPVKKPKLVKMFRKLDNKSTSLVRCYDEEQKDIDDQVESLEEVLETAKTKEDKNVFFLHQYVSRHVVYLAMEKLLTTCNKAEGETKKQLSLHFLNMCEQSLLPPDVILGLYLEICQGAELLKQAEFTQEITTFLNQSTDSHNVDKLLPPMVQLCLQSPKNVVYNIIHRALESKGHIPTLAKLLSEVSIICRYKEKSHPSNLLTTSLKSFMKKATSAKQVDNLVYLIQELVKFKPPKDPLDLSEFTSVVIVPLLRPDSNPLQTDLACQLLHTVLDSSSTTLSCNVTVLAVTLVHFSNRCLNSAELNKKDRFFSLLKKMDGQLPKTLSSPELEWLKKQLKDFHPLLKIQAAELFHLPANEVSLQGTNNLEKALLQSTCVEGEGPLTLATKHLNSLTHAIRYASLVAALSKVLPVISHSEWIPVLELVGLLLKDIFEQDNKQEENESTVLMLRTTTDALVVHQKNSIPTNWSYVLSSYGQTIKHFSSRLEKDSEHICYAFCEVCRLANAFPAESSQHLLGSLLHLAGQALTSAHKDSAAMLKVAVNGIASEVLKASLQAKLDDKDDK